MAENTYYTLLTSLPHIDSLFGSNITPISRIQLDRRLSMLSPEDREILVKIEYLVHWDHFGDDIKEDYLINMNDRLITQLDSSDLKELVNWRLDINTIIAALRRKVRGQQAPSNAKWSYGSRYAYIRRNWSNPNLGLSHAFPWIPVAVECLNKKDYLALEKTIMEAVWHKLNQLNARHLFDFEDVVIYLLRWNLVASWTTYNGDEALIRFNDLNQLALGEFAIQFSGTPNHIISNKINHVDSAS
ncbi:MAG: DUF2764 family protein [Candidatus Endonucleobacter bathymodioli]|uniref:DUF2764 family protein n=1 Tax=Candidatus Endonucleibacter bathymodioli TaxID=539814 RepID=A0AA90NNJ9_9GAMM|nr:DUF2764 family protein [Candidatus Endonucleobacter bathymodioli]